MLQNKQVLPAKSEFLKDALRLLLMLGWAYSVVEFFAFPQSGILIFALGGAGYAASKQAKRETCSAWMAAISVLFSAAIYVGGKLVVGDTYYGSYEVNYLRPYSSADIPLVLLLLLGNLLLFAGLESMLKQVAFTRRWNETAVSYKTWAACSAVIFAGWLPYALANYPGLIFGDSLSSVRQALGLEEWSNHFPVFYTLFIKLCLWIGMKIADINFGCFLYTLFQMLFTSAVLGYEIYWLARRGLPPVGRVALTLFFALLNVFSLHAISLWKDAFFSDALLLLALQLAEVAQSKGAVLQKTRFLLRYTLWSVLACLSRNNGIYVVFVIDVILCILYGRKKKREGGRKARRFMVWFAATILALVAVTGPVYSALGIGKARVESIGIPLQQMARVVVCDGNMSERERETMDAILPLEKYAQVYTPCCVDNLKWAEGFDLKVGAKTLAVTYLGMMVKNPKIYIDAWLLETWGYWAVNSWQNNFCEYNLTTLRYEESLGMRKTNLLRDVLHLDTQVGEKLTYQFLTSAVLSWITLLQFAFLLSGKHKEYALAMLPSLGVWGTLMISSPLAEWLRYVLVMAYSLPLILFIPMILEQQSNTAPTQQEPALNNAG